MAVPQTADVVTVDGAGKRFGSLTALSGVKLTVPKGTILGVIGPSGAGKTTLIRLLTGALAPTSGTIRVLGEDPRRFRRRTREGIGYMPQQFTLYEDLTAGENIDFVAGLFGMLWLRRRRRVAEVLKLTDLWDARGRRAADLSGGMQRRLELACALVHEPALFFLDEPTAGIDPLLRGTIWQELHRLKDEGRTLLITTQYINEAEECDRVAFIAHGRLIALETPAALTRLAVGGDIIEVQVVHAFDAEALLKHDDVRAVDQRGPRTFLVTVDDASTALPEIDDRVIALGGEFESAREYRPSFDEVFAALVERDEREQARPPGDGGAAA
jgi:ABC-2 type transport system ATP-binding protein